jgi:hypothetical protein
MKGNDKNTKQTNADKNGYMPDEYDVKMQRLKCSRN